MPSINDVFSSGNTLKADDLKGKPPASVTVDNIQVKEFEETKNGETFKKKKLVISFRGTQKTLVCNVTNARIIAELYGNDYSTWPGQKLLLKADKTNFAGKLVDCIRVADPNDKIQSGPPPKKVPPPPSEDMDDAIPF